LGTDISVPDSTGNTQIIAWLDGSAINALHAINNYGRTDTNGIVRQALITYVQLTHRPWRLTPLTLHLSDGSILMLYSKRSHYLIRMFTGLGLVGIAIVAVVAPYIHF
jgi:hypothetical protein